MLPLNPSSLPDSGRNALMLPLSDNRNILMASWGSAKLLPIPALAKYAVFDSEVNFFLKFGDLNVVAQVPQADVLDGTAGDYNPQLRPIPDGSTHLSVVPVGTGMIFVAFYR